MNDKNPFEIPIDLPNSGIRVLRDGAVSMYIDAQTDVIDGDRVYQRIWVDIRDTELLAKLLIQRGPAVVSGAPDWSVHAGYGVVEFELESDHCGKFGRTLTPEDAESIGLALIKLAHRARKNL